MSKEAKSEYEIRLLKERVECLGEIANVCVFDDIGRICSYCRCPKGKASQSLTEESTQ